MWDANGDSTAILLPSETWALSSAKGKGLQTLTTRYLKEPHWKYDEERLKAKRRKEMFYANINQRWELGMVSARFPENRL